MRVLALLTIFAAYLACADSYDPGNLTVPGADARYLRVTDEGDLTISGHYYEHDCRAFAYLVSPATTTVTTAGTFYPVEGVFSNVILDGFALGTQGGKPAIVYTNRYAGYFEVCISSEAQVSSSDAPANVSLGLRVSGVDLTTGGMTEYLKTGDEPQSWTAIALPPITNGATVQLTVTTDADGDEVIFDEFRTSIRRFR